MTHDFQPSSGDEGDFADFVPRYATYHFETPGKSVRNGRTSCRLPRFKKTRGAVKPGAEIAYVYVAQGKRGPVKVGITASPPERMAGLRTSLVACFPIRPDAALAVETEALASLGRVVSDSEWVRLPPKAVVQAVTAAFGTVRKYKHVDPHLSPDEARALRISIAR